MKIYYFIMVALCITGLLQWKFKIKNIYIVSFWVLLFIVIGALRWKVGYDFGYYSSHYYEFSGLRYDQLDKSQYFPVLQTYEHYEKGWILFSSLISQFYPKTYKPLFLVYSVIVYSAIGYKFYKDSKSPWLSIFIFFMCGYLYNSFCFMRQMMAAVIVLYSFQYIKRNDFISYCAVILCATTFHASAFIMIPLYLIMKVPYNKYLLIIYVIIVAIVYVYSFDILNIVTKFMYYDYQITDDVELSMGLVIWYSIPCFLLLIASLPLMKDLSKEDETNLIYFYSLLFACSFIVISWHHAVISRFAIYFYLPGMCLFAPTVCAKYKEIFEKNNYKIGKVKLFPLICTLIVVLLCCYQYALLQNNFNGVVPYLTYQDEKMMIGKVK